VTKTRSVAFSIEPESTIAAKLRRSSVGKFTGIGGDPYQYL
jgi:hypothetical protein